MPRSYSQGLRGKLMGQLESGRLTHGQAGGLLSASPRTVSPRHTASRHGASVQVDFQPLEAVASRRP